MSLTRRANMAFAVILALTAAVSATVFVMARSTSSRITSYQARTAVLSTAVADLRADFFNYDDQMNMYVAVLTTGAGQRDLADRTYQEAVLARQRMTSSLSRAEELTTDGGLLAQLKAVREARTAFDGFAEQTRTAAQAGDVQAAITLSTVTNVAASDAITAALTDAAARLRTTVASELAALLQRQRIAEVASVVSGVLVVGMVVLLRMGLAVEVLRPLRLLRDAMAGVAGDGDRSARLPVRRDDEFGVVAVAFNGMLAALETQEVTIQQGQAEREAAMQDNFQRTRNAERDVRLRAQGVIDDSASAVVAELREVIKQVDTVRIATSTIDERVSAANSITRAVVDRARQAGAVVDDLGESLHRVGGMATLIAGVAGQTKLLALNATIEAVRAGQSGEGFNVVASEVKELAATTARSTKEITDTIGSLEESTTAVTTAIAEMTSGIGVVDEATAVLASVATQQHALVESLNHSVAGAIARIENMTTLTERLERRRYRRVALDGTASLNLGATEHTVRLIDMSEGGVRCHISPAVNLPDGAEAAVVLHLAERQLRLRVRALRRERGLGDDETAFEFVAPEPAMVEVIRNYLNDIVGHHADGDDGTS